MLIYFVDFLLFVYYLLLMLANFVLCFIFFIDLLSMVVDVCGLLSICYRFFCIFGSLGKAIIGHVVKMSAH